MTGFEADQHQARIARIAADYREAMIAERKAVLERLLVDERVSRGKRKGKERDRAVYQPNEDRRRLVLRLVEECHIYDCAPPLDLIEAIKEAFFRSDRHPLTPSASIADETTVRLMAGEAGIPAKSWALFKRAAEIDCRLGNLDGSGSFVFGSGAHSVAAAVSSMDETKKEGRVLDPASVLRWRKIPAYLSLIEAIRHATSA